MACCRPGRRGSRLGPAAVLLLVLAAPLPARGDTPVGGWITTNTTWDVPGAPYIVYSNVHVREGATLTIRPGVEVRLDPNQSIIVDNSRLIAAGTADSIIVFTRSTPGRWGALAGFGADMTFRFCRVEWGSQQNYITLHEGLISNAYGSTIVEDCVLRNSGLDATEFEGGSVIFRRNVVSTIYRQGFNSWNHCQSVVEDNRVASCFDDAYSITSVNGAEVLFRNNMALDVGDDGLDIDHFGYTRIGPFEAYNVNDKGVSVSLNSISVVVENTIVADATEAFTVTNNSAVSLFNCVAYNCTRGFSAYERNTFFGGGRLVVANSIVWDTTTPVYLDSLSTATIFYSILNTPTPYPGVGNRNTDPRFVDGPGFVFLINPDSPAIDAGYSDGVPEFDIRGRARVDVPAVPNTGGGPFTYYDIGAYEFIPQAAAVVAGGAPAAPLGLHVFPSPAAGPVAIAFDLPARRQVAVGVYDAAGRLVAPLFSGPLAAGRHGVSWPADARTPRGIYFVRLTAGSEAAVEKVVRLR